MTVEYSRRAVADILDIADYYERNGVRGAGPLISARIAEVIARLSAWPESGRLVARERGLRVVPLVRYPYLVFYEVPRPGMVRILHIRHASRRSWMGK